MTFSAIWQSDTAWLLEGPSLDIKIGWICRSIYEVMPKHLSKLYLGNHVPKPMPDNEDLWEVKPGQATGFKP